MQVPSTGPGTMPAPWRPIPTASGRRRKLRAISAAAGTPWTRAAGSDWQEETPPEVERPSGPPRPVCVFCPPGASMDKSALPGRAASAGAQNHVWSNNYGGLSGGRFAKSVAVDWAGNTIVVGRYSGSVNFGGALLTSASMNDAITIANLVGSVIVTGTYAGSVDFGGGPLPSGGDSGRGPFGAHGQRRLILGRRSRRPQPYR